MRDIMTKLRLQTLLTVLLAATAVSSTVAPRLYAADAPQCTICMDEYTKDDIIVQYDCGVTPTNGNHGHNHLACAEQLVRRASKCPVCMLPANANGKLKIHDPRGPNKAQPTRSLSRNRGRNGRNQWLIRGGAKAGDAIKHRSKPLTQQEATLLNKLLASQNTQVSKKAVPQPILGRPKKKKKVKPSYRPDMPQVNSFNISEWPKELLKNMTDEEYELNFGQKRSNLPIAPGTYSDALGVNKEDVRLNSQHLPPHLNPREWQVIMQPNGNLARMKREKRLSQWPPAGLYTSGNLEQLTELVKGYNGDIMVGALFGLLIGPEFTDTKPPLINRMLYIPAAYGGYKLLESMNPNRTWKPKHASRIAAGVGIGAGIHYLINNRP